MTAPAAYLCVALAGGLLAWNAVVPFARNGRPAVLAYFGGWITSELPLHHLVLQLAAAAMFVGMGALDAWPGWVGLAVTLASCGALAQLLVGARRARSLCERALVDTLGGGYANNLTPALVSRRRDIERVRDVSYGPFGAFNQLDIYRRREVPRVLQPVLIQVHGGGWIHGRKELNGRPLMFHLAARGWVCVAINYRLSPRATYPDHVVDVKRAIAWVKAHIAEYGGDPGFVAITGGSAGGHLSALAALAPEDRELQPGFEDADTCVQACVPCYGVYDFTNRSGLGQRAMTPLLERLVFKQSFATAHDAFDRASPLSRITAAAPPFLVVHGVNDTLAPVAEARLFVDQLRQVSHANVAYIELPRTQHAFDVFRSVRTNHVVAAAARYLAYHHAAHRRSAATDQGGERSC